jgi:hypothetical protein
MSEAKRAPVDYRYNGLNWDFIKMMAQIASYADEKYGSAEQYADSRLTGDKSPINHIPEHLRQYLTGESHDHFDDPIYHLVAIAYNAMIAALYHRRYGPELSRLDLRDPRTTFSNQLSQASKEFLEDSFGQKGLNRLNPDAAKGLRDKG